MVLVLLTVMPNTETVSLPLVKAVTGQLRFKEGTQTLPFNGNMLPYLILHDINSNIRVLGKFWVCASMYKIAINLKH